MFCAEKLRYALAKVVRRMRSFVGFEEADLRIRERRSPELDGIGVAESALRNKGMLLSMKQVEQSRTRSTCSAPCPRTPTNIQPPDDDGFEESAGRFGHPMTPS